MSAGVLVIAEQRDGSVSNATWEVVAAAQSLGGAVSAVVPGSRRDAEAGAQALAAASLVEVIALEHDGLAVYTADGYATALAAFIQSRDPSHVLIAHTYQARDFAPTLATRLDRALVSDCVGLGRADTGVVFTRPMFQGKVVADVVVEGPAPHFASIQIGAFRADTVVRGEAPAPVTTIAASLEASAIRQRPEAPFREAKQTVDLMQAERIVAAGRGVKAAEHIALVRELAEALGAEVAASRPVCDAGWLPLDRQVGSSGQTVAPRLYVAVGISGAIQHVVGMKGARTVVAINRDADAPIFEIADYGIVGDLFEVVPALIAALKA
jgi:electron transfer flavoprotein alpha subunit